MEDDEDGVVLSFDEDEDDDDMANLFSFGGEEDMPNSTNSADPLAALASVMPLPPPKTEDAPPPKDDSDSFLHLDAPGAATATTPPTVDPAATTSTFLPKEQDKSPSMFSTLFRQTSSKEDIDTTNKEFLDPDDEFLSAKEDVDFGVPIVTRSKSQEEAETEAPSNPKEDLEARNAIVLADYKKWMASAEAEERPSQWALRLQQLSGSKSATLSLEQLVEEHPAAVAFAKFQKDEKKVLGELTPFIQAAVDAWTAEIAQVQGEETKDLQDLVLWLRQPQQKQAFTSEQILPMLAVALAAGLPAPAVAALIPPLCNAECPLYLADANDDLVQAAWAPIFAALHPLTAYHLPLISVQLDKWAPEWYTAGNIPVSALLGYFVGQTTKVTVESPQDDAQTPASEDGEKEAPKKKEVESTNAVIRPWVALSGVIRLWDVILGHSHGPSFCYFLVVSWLEWNSRKILLAPNATELNASLADVLTFSKLPEDVGEDGIAEWIQRAQALELATPESVLKGYTKLQDQTVRTLAEQRQIRLDRQLAEQVRAEHERQAEEARLRLTKARLVAFYRQYNPGKESNVDKIMETYKGRYEVLDAKLKQKYGIGFRPALKPKPTPAFAKLSGRKEDGGKPKRPNLFSRFNINNGGSDYEGTEDSDNDASPVAVLQVEPGEVVSSICWSKQAAQAQRLRQKQKDARLPLKYYLVDCRPEKARSIQGRFPTAAALGPEQFDDKEQLAPMLDVFESLRGTVHFVVMGEGFSALPELYGHKVTHGLREFIQEDEKRMRSCSHFFVQKGFPFVSILRGGFAAAHAWLCREGPEEFDLRAANVLTDYHPNDSLFGQFEALYQDNQRNVKNAFGERRTQQRLQNMLDSSMTVLTQNAQRVHAFASELEGGASRQEGEGGNATNFNMGNLFRGLNNNDPESKEEEGQDKQRNLPFRNPFAKNKGEEAASGPADIAESSNVDETATLEGPEAMNRPAIPFRNPFARKKSDGGRDNSSGTKDEDSFKSDSKPNRFSGLGAALRKPRFSGKAVDSGGAPKFPRFGMGNLQKRESSGPRLGVALDNFRKVAQARVRGGEADSSPVTTAALDGQVDETGNDAADVEDELVLVDSNVVEESETFDQSSPSKTHEVAPIQGLEDLSSTGGTATSEGQTDAAKQEAKVERV